MLFPLIGSPLNIILITGLTVFAGLFVVGFAFNPLSDDRSMRTPTLNKMLMSALLVAAALVWWWAGAAGTRLAAFGMFISVGMLFGLIGDLSLAEVLPTPHPVIFGIVAFLVGHIFYILGFAHVARTLALTNAVLLIAVIVAFEIIAVVLWVLLVRAPQAGRTLNVGSLVYSVGISAMAANAAWLALQEPRLTPLAVGATLFLVSDLILGMRLLRDVIFLMVRDVVWLLYISGQALIVFSVGTVLNLL